jgi:pimeloyl-ACP methyl ester carboxylesterase
MKSRIVFIPGLGADARLFRHQKSIFKNAITPPWLTPQKGESLSHYAQRWSQHLKLVPGCILVGVSFGGMVVLEMARWVKPKAVILIASCQGPASVPWLWRITGQLPAWPFIGKTLTKMFPGAGSRFLGAETKEQQDLLVRMLFETRDSFMRWTLRAIQGWDGFNSEDLRIYHIHGKRDHLIPIQGVEPNQVVKDGGHLINLTHAKEVNEFIKKYVG